MLGDDSFAYLIYLIRCRLVCLVCSKVQCTLRRSENIETQQIIRKLLLFLKTIKIKYTLWIRKECGGGSVLFLVSVNTFLGASSLFLKSIRARKASRPSLTTKAPQN